MNMLEKELEDVVEEMIIKKHQNLPPIMHYDNLLRQFNLGRYGTPDLIGYTIKKVIPFKSYRHIYLNIGVFELKKDKITIDAFCQVMRYCKGVREYLQYISSKFKKQTYIFSPDFNIYNIGKSIDLEHESLCYLPAIIYDYYIYTYNYGIDGIKFRLEDGYYINQNKFNRNYNDLQKSLIGTKYAGLF